MSVAGEMGPDGLIPTTDRFGTALADIVRCARCGHMQLEPMPAAQTLAEAYKTAASDEYVEEEGGQRETARRVLSALERLAPLTPSPPGLLDLGCWVGFLMAEARARGWRTVGVEPSSFAARYASEQLGLNVIHGDLFGAVLPEHEFAAVTLGDVIEHLTDPADALSRIRRLLRPGGVLWLALPDAGSRLARALGPRWWSVIPTHVQYFTRNSVATLLTRSGFEPLELSTAPKAFTVRYYASRLNGYSPALGSGLVRLAGLARVAQRTWTPDFRDRMAVIARVRQS